uniref:Uncharacterized protein n=1 Tax=Anguilla anguilla TaxID=7936 RepID=A0A0E9RNL3_ANGAN
MQGESAHNLEAQNPWQTLC